MTAGMPTWLVRAQALHRMARVRHWATNGTSVRLGPAAQAALTLPLANAPHTVHTEPSSKESPSHHRKHARSCRTCARALQLPGAGAHCPGGRTSGTSHHQQAPACAHKPPPAPFHGATACRGGRRVPPHVMVPRAPLTWQAHRPSGTATATPAARQSSGWAGLCPQEVTS